MAERDSSTSGLDALHLPDTILQEDLDISSLNTSIFLLRQAARSLHPDRQELRHCLHHLAGALLIRFGHTHELDDLHKACRSRVTALTGEGEVNLSLLSLGLEVDDFEPDSHPLDMMALATELLSDFNAHLNLEKLDKAISLYRHSLSSDLDDTRLPRVLAALSEALLARLRIIGQINDLPEAIRSLRQLVQLRPNQVSLLCAALLTPGPEDTERQMIVEVLDLLAHAVDSDGKATRLSAAGTQVLNHYFQQSRSLHDLDAGIIQLGQAESQLTWGHPVWADTANNLARALRERYDQRGEMSDFNSAFELQREALSLLPAHHPNRVVYLENLANLIYAHSTQTGEARDLAFMVDLNREVLQRYPAPHPHRDVFLHNLAKAIMARFEP